MTIVNKAAPSQSETISFEFDRGVVVIREGELDEPQVRAWVKQAAALRGEVL